MNRLHTPLLKLFLLGVLSLLLLIPLVRINVLVSERSARAIAAQEEIAGQWGNVQTLAPAYLVTDVDQRPTRDGLFPTPVSHAQLPSKITVDAGIAPQILHRGMFQLPVYVAALTVDADFSAADVAALRALGGEHPLRIALGVSDVRGLRGLPELSIDGAPATVATGQGNLPGLSALEVELDAAKLERGFHLHYKLDLAGVAALRMLPLARVSEAAMTSPWPHPSFDGGFLPTDRDVGAEGFKARWQVIDLNRRYPQQFALNEIGLDTLQGSTFGVSLYQPAGVYQQNERSGKYAFLMIALVFNALFLFEVLLGLTLHPIQYALIGSGLVLFQLLELALSEHLGFAPAYGVAAAASVLLIGAYARAILGDFRRALLLAALQGAAYAMFFFLIRSEDYALLMGSTTLFTLLAVVMYLTRRIDWSRIGATPA